MITALARPSGRRPRWREKVWWRGEAWRIGAQVLRPGGLRGVYVAHDGELPGREIPAGEWSAAVWDPMRELWVVPTDRAPAQA